METSHNPPAMNPVKRFVNLLSVDKKDIFYIYLYAAFNGIIYLSLPLGIQAIISQVLANELSTSWVILIVVVTLGTMVFGALQIIQMAITEMLQQRIFSRAAFEFAFRFPRMKMEALMNYFPPELVNRFFDTLNIQKALPKILIDFSTATLQIIFGLILLSFYHAFFVFFGIGLLVLLLLIIWITGPRGLRTSLEESKYKYQVVYWLEEVARTLSTFKLAGGTDLAMRKTDELVASYLKARKQHFRVLVIQFINVVGFKTIITAGLLILGSVLLIRRELNVGQFVASEIIILMVLSSVEKLMLSMETVYDVLTAVEKIGKVTDMPLERHTGINFKEISRPDGMKLTLQDVSFNIPDSPHVSINKISFQVEPGEKVCIAGFTGAGKSVLLNLISGLYDSYSGVISYNDISVRDIDPLSVRTSIGDCLSQKILFRGTVLENLTMGRPEVELKDVQWALDRLQLSEFVQSLPNGLHTVLVPEGVQIPQGISRKLILARCLAKRPQLLVMEDFFSLWEPKDRSQICEFLTCGEMQTVVAISNDKMFASLCDRVIVLDHGMVMDMDSYYNITSKRYFQEIFH
ncbi:MAG: ABC transporter ATP-binding protein [Bacteroidota bacterium]